MFDESDPASKTFTRYGAGPVSIPTALQPELPVHDASTSSEPSVSVNDGSKPASPVGSATATITTLPVGSVRS